PPPPYESCVPLAPPDYSQTLGTHLPASAPETSYSRPTTTIQIIPLGPQSTRTTCPYCFAQVDTTIKTEPGMIAYISGVVIALMGCWFGCCLIPCCIDECMDVHHSCSNCKAYLGHYRK
ncbi:LITAF-like protein, partial [Eufriesea mexicana]